MESIKEFTIHLYFLDSDGEPWSLHSVTQGESIIEPELLEPNGFYEASGGIRLFKNRIYCFLDTTAAGDLASYVIFLLSSLIGLLKDEYPEDLDVFKEDPLFQNRTQVIAKIYHLDQSLLILSERDNNVVLDFLDKEGLAPETRGRPYFHNIIIDSKFWIKAALLALQEYFHVVQTIGRTEFQEKDENNPLNRIQSVWEHIARLYSKPHS